MTSLHPRKPSPEMLLQKIHMEQSANDILIQDDTEQIGWLTKFDRYGLLREVLTPENIKLTSLCLFWYSSSAVTNNIAKQIFEVAHLPVTLTFVQFAFVAIFCFLFGFFSSVDQISILQQQYFTFQGKSTPARLGNVVLRLMRYVAELFRFWIALGLGIHEEDFVVNVHTKHISSSQRFMNTHIRLPTVDIIKTMAPLSVFLISGHVFSSIALSNVPVSFVHTIKALSPLFTVLIFRFIFKAKYKLNIYLSLVPLTAGVMFATSYELSFNFLGFFCSLASTIIFVSQNIFSKYLFKGRKLDKLNMLLYSSGLSFLLMSPIWFWSEGHSTVPMSPYVIFLFVLNGLSHFMQNVFAFSILSLVSPVTYSIASLIKRIVVIVASILWFGQQVGKTQSFGILLTFVGLWMYQHAKHQNRT